eukprot:TRINITY_DN5428_c0_g1_i12.p1 TRINITY_DN5428_c0_g1~~TRINITY_DN5428_c0_g1_i12.p1  ORF type:complete len:423 (-),score=168.29 TRINITY_DN5428_c0_g1_i12:149-1417(-)
MCIRDRDMLGPEQTEAMCHVRANAKQQYGEAFVSLLPRVKKLGYTEAQLQRAMDYIREEAPIIIHFHIDKCIDFFLKDTHYRNQFETGSSSGSLSRASRTQWENDLFSNAYANAQDFDRCKYGVMNVVNDPAGLTAAYQYGDSYMVLKHVRLRCSFSSRDSGAGQLKMLACCDYYAHVLQEFSDPELEAVLSVGTGTQNYVASSVIAQYKECQIHGEVALNNDVAAFVINSKHRGKYTDKLEKLSQTHGVPVMWMDEVDPSQISEVAELERQRSMKEARVSKNVTKTDPAELERIQEEEKKRVAAEIKKSEEEAKRSEEKAKETAAAEEKARIEREGAAIGNFVEVTGCLDLEKARAFLREKDFVLDAAVEAYMAQPPVVVEVSEEVVMQLVEMGFEYETAKAALEATGGDFGTAMEQLLCG